MVHDLFLVRTGGGAVIWLAVMDLTLFVTVIRPSAFSEKAGMRLIVWGGCVFPIAVLAILVWFGTAMMPDLRGRRRRSADSGVRRALLVARALRVDGEPGVAKSLPLGGTESAN